MIFINIGSKLFYIKPLKKRGNIYIYCDVIIFVSAIYLFQEIELKRSCPSERLGMTLCYEDEDGEGNTEICIGEI